jgi:hypothetical protein
MHLVAGTEHAFRVADIRAFDLHDFRHPGRTIPSSRDQQAPHGLRLRAKQVLRGPTPTRLDVHRLGHEWY